MAEMKSDEDAGAERWWRTYELPPATWAAWQIGPLRLTARHDPGEWSFRWGHEADPLTDQCSFLGPQGEDAAAADEQTARYVLGSASGRLRLQPLLADLPVIARPATPLYIPAQEETTLFVSTVLWLQVLDQDRLLMEIPILRPSDTWFGADTTDGELCYASRTKARTGVDSLDHLPHRAVTAVLIANEAETGLQVQQLRVPVPALSLYAGAAGELWTNEIKLTRAADSSEAALELLDRIPVSGGCERLAEPRVAAPDEPLVRAFSRLFN